MQLSISLAVGHYNSTLQHPEASSRLTAVASLSASNETESVHLWQI